MSIKLRTEQKHRFGRAVNIHGEIIQVSLSGEISVEEDIVVYAIENGFELVDKNVTFTSKTEQNKAKEVEQIISNAKLQAEQIISTATKEAEQIIAKAKIEAEKVKIVAQVDEKTELRKQLENKTVKELKEILIVSGASQEELNGIKKEDLISLIVGSTFPESK